MKRNPKSQTLNPKQIPNPNANQFGNWNLEIGYCLGFRTWNLEFVFILCASVAFRYEKEATAARSSSVSGLSGDTTTMPESVTVKPLARSLASS